MGARAEEEGNWSVEPPEAVWLGVGALMCAV